MNQKRFTKADIMGLIIVILFGMGCLLGVNFQSLGDIKFSIFLAGCIVLLLFGIAYCAKLLKIKNNHFVCSFVLEIIMLILLTGLTALFAYSPFSHFFFVSGNRMVIKSELVESITQAEKMFEAYDNYAKNRENLYRSRLQAIVATKNTMPNDYQQHGFDKKNVADSIQIKDKLFILHTELFPAEYEEMKKTSLMRLSKAKQAIDWWRPLQIIRIVNSIEQDSKQWLETIISISKARATGEQASDYAFALSFADVKSYFTEKSAFTPLSIVLAVITWLILLLSYLVAYRSAKSTIFVRNRKKSDN